ncbi:nuclease-related domain-containing protein [Nitrosopumilus sp.]|uniref:nuclease-related domain-containing protein n=1 Tax=Nitrosopumilus sp. TaxID=2024843 RepID=UPI00247EC430|nr:nuclease-related domain-containing protein [Nitrosopumilus sp.]MCV0431481.1 NERD domain-containing protein [Nitrosopumilus sp.]
MAIIHGLADTEKRLLDKLPKEVKSIDDMDSVKKEFKKQYHSIEDKGLRNKFSRWRKKRQILKIARNQNTSLHSGTKGEIRALDTLSQLDDSFHVLCGVNLELPHYVTYNGKRSLKSAQMDFVIVSQKGIQVIEVKNWTDTYIFKNRENGGLEPHEQVNRAGRVMWISLKEWFGMENPNVSAVLLPIRGNMKYSTAYRFVAVKDLVNIIPWIEKKKEILSDDDVEKIVKKLKKHVTK